MLYETIKLISVSRGRIALLVSRQAAPDSHLGGILLLPRFTDTNIHFLEKPWTLEILESNANVVLVHIVLDGWTTTIEEQICGC